MNGVALENFPVLLSKTGLIEGRILRRWKRFLCDVELAGGEVVTAHCTNTGTMATCWEEGDTVLLEANDNPRRKLRFTWIACRREETWVGIETGIPNKVVAEAARRNLLPGMPGLRDICTEVRYGLEGSRIDVLARDSAGREVYIEVKNATLRIEHPDGPVVCFPDAVTTRGAKHLRELQAVVEGGQRGCIAFFIHRSDARTFDVARHIDPAYGDELDRALAAGVEILPLSVGLEPKRHPDGSWDISWRLPGLLPGKHRKTD